MGRVLAVVMRRVGGGGKAMVIVIHAAHFDNVDVIVSTLPVVFNTSSLFWQQVPAVGNWWETVVARC